MRKKCMKIVEHGVNCFINRQLIYNFPESILTGERELSNYYINYLTVLVFVENNVITIEHADFDGIERLAAVLGGEIASTFDRPELAKLGQCALIDEVMIGEDKLIRFSGCADGKACTIVLRGASSHLLGEL